MEPEKTERRILKAWLHEIANHLIRTRLKKRKERKTD